MSRDYEIGMLWVEGALSYVEVLCAQSFLDAGHHVKLYHYKDDPDALKNLAGKPEHQEELKKMRAILVKQMEETEDPVLPAFREYLESTKD